MLLYFQGCCVSGFASSSHSSGPPAHLQSSCASRRWISYGNSTSVLPNTWFTICWSILVPFLMGSERARSVLVSYPRETAAKEPSVGQKKSQTPKGLAFSWCVCYLTKVTIWFCFVPGMSRRSWTLMVAVTTRPARSSNF